MLPSINHTSSSNKNIPSILKESLISSHSATTSKVSFPKVTPAFACLGPDREPFDIWTQLPASEENLLRDLAVNICDCLDPNCSGCFFPCSVCHSPKCSSKIREPSTFVFDLFWDHRLRDICKYQIENRGSLQSCKKYRDWVVYKVQDSCSSRARWLDPQKDAAYKAAVDTVCTLPYTKSRDSQPTASYFAGDLPPLPADAPDDLTDPRDLSIDRFLRTSLEKRASPKLVHSSSSSTSSSTCSASSSSSSNSGSGNRVSSRPPAKLARIELDISSDAEEQEPSSSVGNTPAALNSLSAAAFSSATINQSSVSASSAIVNRASPVAPPLSSLSAPVNSSGAIEIEDNDINAIVIDDDSDEE